jgi:hypothetical protein
MQRLVLGLTFQNSQYNLNTVLSDVVVLLVDTDRSDTVVICKVSGKRQ